MKLSVRHSALLAVLTLYSHNAVTQPAAASAVAVFEDVRVFDGGTLGLSLLFSQLAEVTH